MMGFNRCPAGKLALVAALALAFSAASARGESKAEAARAKLRGSRAHVVPLPPPAEVKESSEAFEVGAQYRGGLKKTFHELGTGTLGFRTIKEDTFAVSLEARVKHPQSQELIECRIQRQYRLSGHRIIKVSENDWFNTAGEKHRKRFIDCVSLGYLVKWNTPRAEKGPFAEQHWQLDGQTYAITYTPSERWLEATLRSKDGVVGKFFLKPSQGGVRPVDKFRVFAREELVVSFVKKTGLQPTSAAP